MQIFRYINECLDTTEIKDYFEYKAKVSAMNQKSLYLHQRVVIMQMKYRFDDTSDSSTGFEI